jgi:hypothetical protein
LVFYRYFTFTLLLSTHTHTHTHTQNVYNIYCNMYNGFEKDQQHRQATRQRTRGKMHFVARSFGMLICLHLETNGFTLFEILSHR